MKYTDRTRLLNNTLAHLTTRESCIITLSMVKKIAAADLGYCHLDFVYKQDGPYGFVAMF